MSDDDKATVVLDMNALKEELKKQKEITEKPQDLEFTAGTQSNIKKPIMSAAELKVILFDFGTDYFSKLVPSLPKDFSYSVVNDVKALSQYLKGKDRCVVLFNYNLASKATNQLCAQIKQKFSHVKTVICAKGLTPEKAKAHKSSASGANEYLTLPIDNDQLLKALKQL